MLLYYQDKYGKSRDEIKQLFTMLGFGASYKTWFRNNNVPFDDDEFIQDLNQEYYELGNIIYEKNPHIITDVINATPTRFMRYTDEVSLLSAKKRCVMAMYYQTIERVCQELCITYLVDSKGFNIKHIVPCQDGFMILKDKYYPDICAECAYILKDKLRFDLKFTVKEFDEKYTIPAFVSDKELAKTRREEEKALKKQQLIDEAAKKRQEHENTIATKMQIKEDAEEHNTEYVSELEKEKQRRFEEFEINHVKIINKGVYLNEFSDKTLVKTKKQMVDAYEHMPGILKKTAVGIVKCKFIEEWTCMNPTIRSKDDMNIFPPPLVVPENMYNLWKPFDGQVLVTKPYTPRLDALDRLRHHIYILCNRDREVSKYFELWIAQMIQFPAIKSNCPILISKEGAGKGTLLQVISRMIGTSKYHETTTPERDVWGSFNSMMADNYFVNLNELSKQQTADAMGIIKGLITDGALTINTKGVPQYKITSYHRWIITTNKDDPIPTKHDDRRFWIVRSSDELINNKQYFTELHELMEDVNVQATVFNYFNTLEGADNFRNLKMPNTEYQKNLQDGNVSIPELWLKDFVTTCSDDQVEFLGSHTYQSFNAWKDRMGVKYEINSLKLGVQLSNLGIPGILKGRHTNKGTTKIFDIKQLKKHFGVDCLVQLSEGEMY
jgi:hypothetical protein